MTDLCRPGPLVIVAMRIPPLFLAALVAICSSPLRAELVADGDDYQGAGASPAG